MPEQVTKLSEQYSQGGGPSTPEGLYCQDLFREYSASSYRKRKEKEIRKGRERYRNVMKDVRGPWEGAAAYSLGLTRIAVDKLEPRIMKRLVAEDDFIQAAPTGPEDKEFATDVRDFLQWAVRNNIKAEKAMRGHVHDLLLDGTKDIIPIWEEEQRTTKVRKMLPTFRGPMGPIEGPAADKLAAAMKSDPQAAQMMLSQMGIQPGPPVDSVEEVEVSDFRIKWEAVDLADSFFPDDGKDFSEQPWMRWIYVNIEDLKAKEADGPYKNISDQLAPLMSTAERHEEISTDTAGKGVSYSQYAREAKLLECYIKWDGEWKLCTFAPDYGWIEVRNQSITDIYWHGRKPIVRLPIYKESDESMGTGIPTIIKHFHHGLNALWNQMLDHGTAEIMPIGFYNEGSLGMRGKTIKGKPGVLTGIPKDANVHFPNIPVKAPVLINFIETLMTFFERTLSIMDYNMGRASGSTGKGGDTAAGMQMIVQEGEISHNYMGDGVAYVYEQLLTDTLSLYAQNLPMDFKMNVFQGNEWVFSPVNIQALQGRYDITVSISDKSNNSYINKQNKIGLLSLLSKLPGMNLQKLIEQVLEADGYKDLDEFFQPQFQLIQQALQVGGQELVQMLQQFLQQKEQQGKEQKIEGQAKDNIMRQRIERDVEDEELENMKLVDRAQEKKKKEVIDGILEYTGGRV